MLALAGVVVKHTSSCCACQQLLLAVQLILAVLVSNYWRGTVAVLVNNNAMTLLP